MEIEYKINLRPLTHCLLSISFSRELSKFQFEQKRYLDKEWPVKASVYRYHLDPSDLKKEAAAIAAFSFLVN